MDKLPKKELIQEIDTCLGRNDVTQKDFVILHSLKHLLGEHEHIQAIETIIKAYRNIDDHHPETEDKKRLDNMSESDFIRGRVFGIKRNIRKGIVVKKEARYVTWRWVSSEPGEGTIDNISDLMYWITWLGGIEPEHLTEAEGIESLHA